MRSARELLKDAADLLEEADTVIRDLDPGLDEEDGAGELIAEIRAFLDTPEPGTQMCAEPGCKVGMRGPGVLPRFCPLHNEKNTSSKSD